MAGKRTKTRKEIKLNKKLDSPFKKRKGLF